MTKREFIAARKKLNLSQHGFAKLLQLSRASVSLKEKGLRGITWADETMIKELLTKHK
jgi:DNA-binding XRE family transcriptional regulator